MLFKILTRKLSLDPIELFRAPLAKSRPGRLRLYPTVAKSQVWSNFLKYRHLRELNQFISDNENISDT